MNKVLKKIVYIIGIILLLIVFGLNIVYTAHIEYDEYVEIAFNSIKYVIRFFTSIIYFI
ncbi:MAG: hypothetical protein HFJ54_06970 [Clostridia bacterium]|nr:hypothetical protein [Clostridia bacterium]